ncbi:MAG: winged helix-turn-helix domain-containing protein, partial [Thermoplasmata archaeon]|nr:winged helix-turn-helix domain-containing protein [Thermoplasmata archaeon]
MDDGGNQKGAREADETFFTAHDLTARERILIHLLNYIHLENEYTLPLPVTQPGISGELSIQRPYVSMVLKAMREEGLVVEKTAHITGVQRKRKAYLLTPQGIEAAKLLKERYE